MYNNNKDFYAEVQKAISNKIEEQVKKGLSLGFEDEQDICDLIESMDGVLQVLVHDYSYNGDCIIRCNVECFDEYTYIELSQNFDDTWYVSALLNARIV